MFWVITLEALPIRTSLVGDRSVPPVGRGVDDVPVDQQLAPPSLDTRVLGGEELLVIDRRGLRPDAGRAAEVLFGVQF